MPRSAIACLSAVATVALALAVGAPAGWADRPLSDITCAGGQHATYDRGAHRFSNETFVLGCARLSDGQVLQIDAGHVRGESSPTCLNLTFGPPRRDGLFVCGHRLGSAPRVLLLLRHRSRSPFLVAGVVPGGAERASVTYSSRNGSTERVRGRMIRAGDPLAERVGADQAFGAFVAELGPGVDVCEGIEPRALGNGAFPSRGRPATPRGYPLGRPDGWLAGFAPSYGNGYGYRNPPKLCDQAPAPGLRSALDIVLGRLANLLRSMAAEP